MKFLYLDESGDLGFDFVNKSPSKYFTITIVAVDGIQNNQQFLKIVKEVRRKKFKKGVLELKGSSTTFEVKQYFYNKIKHLPFQIHSTTLNKKKLMNDLMEDKSIVYNSIAKNLIDKINFKEVKNKIEFYVDRSKTKEGMEEFNDYIKSNIKLKLNSKIIINIRHRNSVENAGLQACDMFCHGIYQKYNRQSTRWFSIFSDNIEYEELIETNSEPYKFVTLG